jgi:hypothetical protein
MCARTGDARGECRPHAGRSDAVDTDRSIMAAGQRWREGWFKFVA